MQFKLPPLVDGHFFWPKFIVKSRICLHIQIGINRRRRKRCGCGWRVNPLIADELEGNAPGAHLIYSVIIRHICR